MAWMITHDFINDDGILSPAVGEGNLRLTRNGPLTSFRLLDDDGIVYYRGWIDNDEDCFNQIDALEWARVDSGCTEIQVRDADGQWRTEIG